MSDATAVLDPPDTAPEPKPDWQCRTAECTAPVYGTSVLCTPCMILFGPWEMLTANHEVQVWEPPELEPEPEPEPKPTARRTRAPKPKPDAG